MLWLLTYLPGSEKSCILFLIYYSASHLNLCSASFLDLRISFSFKVLGQILLGIPILFHHYVESDQRNSSFRSQASPAPPPPPQLWEENSTIFFFFNNLLNYQVNSVNIFHILLLLFLRKFFFVTSTSLNQYPVEILINFMDSGIY